jgi:hypothetical protein
MPTAPSNMTPTHLSSSAMMQPMDQTSTAVEYFSAPSSSSGGRYHRVTTMWV